MASLIEKRILKHRHNQLLIGTFFIMFDTKLAASLFKIQRFTNFYIAIFSKFPVPINS